MGGIGLAGDWKPTATCECIDLVGKYGGVDIARAGQVETAGGDSTRKEAFERALPVGMEE